MSKTKWLSIVLTLCLIVSSIVVVSATGETAAPLANTAEKNGIQVSLTTDKDTYAEKEAIELKLLVGNSTDMGIANVKTTISAPSTLSVALGTLTKDFEELPAANLGQNKLYVGLGDVQLPDGADTNDGTGAGNGDGVGDDPVDTPNDGGDNTDNAPAEEEAPDNTVLLIVAVVVLVGSAGGLIFLFATGKIKFKKTFVLLLLAGVMLFPMIAYVSATETETTDEKKLEVATTITVAGQEVTLTATVTWEDADPVVVTRGMAEQALSDFLWAYYAKGFWSDYESTGPSTNVSYTFGGYSPLGNQLTTIEDGTEDTKAYTVCSNYAWQAYWQVMGMPIFGDAINAGSEFLWYYIETSVKNDHVDDLCVMRWHTYHCDHEMQAEGYMLHEKCISKGPLEEYREPYEYEEYVTYTIDIEPVKEYFRNWKENLRPGDIIRLPGHIVTFAGDGWILESGGGKYVKDYGGYGAIDTAFNINATTVENYFLPDGKKTSFRLDKYASGSYARCYSKNGEQEGIAVIRPLDSIFMDDGDGDPSNDPLNPDYYHYGVDRLNWQVEEYDKTELPHTGYTIQNPQFTRMQYPMMNINRTVSVGPYGYAAKGETFTYSVEIINQSNNKEYITTRDEGYKGEMFVDVPVVETLPEGVELVSTNATAIIGNTLYWKIDVAAGKSYDCYYEVRATGEMGYEIVNDGGWVGTIPSNRLVTTIGGRYLTEETVAKMLEVYNSGVEGINSNDGYKISASTTQDAFTLAERIYKIAGINLEMPDMNSMLKILFDQEYIKVQGGLYGKASKSHEGWMHILRDKTVKASDQVWHDMIMNGAYIGGEALWTNNYEITTRRIDMPRVDQQEAGDFIVCWNLVNSGAEGGDAYVTNGWKIIFCLGDSKYISLDSDGVLVTDFTHREIETIFTYNLCVGFRPSQAYEDIYTALGTATNTAGNLTAADLAYKADLTPSNVKLADKFKEKLLAITARDLPYMYESSAELAVPMIGNVYEHIGVDVTTNGLAGHTWASIMQTQFYNTRTPVYDASGWQTSYDIKYYLLDQPMKGYESIRKMLMYYGGSVFGEEVPFTSISQLEPGDSIVFGGKRSTTTVLTYQGVNKRGKFSFVASSYSPIGGYYLGNWSSIMTFSNEFDFMDFFNGPITDGNKELQQGGTLNYGGYIILRPAQGFEDINKRATRDLSEGVLTDYEKQLIANMKEGKVGTNRVHDFIYWAYGQAYIKVSDQFDLTDDKLYYWKCFPSGGNVTTNFEHPVAQMLVNKSWSGNHNGSSSPSKNYGLTDSWDQWKIGDIVIARHKPSGSNVYFAAVYMGNGTFMEKGTKSGYIAKYNSPDELYTSRNWEHIFVLRPDQLFTGATAVPRPSLKDKALTAEEKKVIANLAADYSKIGGNQLDDTVIYVYDSVDVSLSKYFTKSANDTYYALFSSKGVPTSVTLENVNFHRMLVDKSWGGTNFTNNNKDAYTPALKDLAVGDIFVGRYSGGYWYAIYQGNGKFMVGQSAKKAETMTFNDSDNTIYAAQEWIYYFILRPDQLGVKDQYGYLDPIQFGSAETTKGGRELTKEEQAIIKALTAEQCGGSNYNKNFINWVYNKINVNLSDISTTVAGTLNGLLGQGTSSNPVGVKTESKYYPMMVNKSWGGTTVESVTGRYFLAQKDFKIGDVLMIYTKNAATEKNTYWQALYQGDGNFLVEMYGSSTTMKYDQVKKLVDGGTFTKADGTPTATIAPASSYAVIRVSNILGGKPAHVPETSTTPEAPSNLRDITEKALTDAEKAILANLDANYSAIGGNNLPKLPIWAYKQAGIDVSKFFPTNKQVSDVYWDLFPKNDKLKADNTSYFAQMLVAGSYDGFEIDLEGEDGADSAVGSAQQLKIADYQIGDLFIGKGDGKGYVQALYQGNGAFLIVYSGKSAETRTYSDENPIGNNNWNYYMVLRPSQLVGVTPPETPEEPTYTSRELTDEEKAKLAAITLEQVAGSGKYNLGGDSGIGPWFYAQAGLDVSSVLDGSVANTLNSLLSASNGVVTTSKYYPMLVPNSWGGETVKAATGEYVLAKADFKIGDLLAIRTKGASSVYWTALYQGDGKFLVETRSETPDFVTTYEELFAMKSGTTIGGVTLEAWGMYAVLRPSNMLPEQTQTPDEPDTPVEPEQPEGPRDIFEKALTNEEKAAIAAIQVSDYDKSTHGSTNLHAFVKFIYKMANVDVSTAFAEGLNANNTWKKIFTSDGDALNPNYYKQMLVENSYGGSYYGENDPKGKIELQIGDIFVGRHLNEAGTGNVYVQYAYLGNGRYIRSTGGGTAVTEVTSFDKAETTEVVETIFEDQAWYYYFVLRPEQVATYVEPEQPDEPEIIGRELTEEEKAILAAITAEEKITGQLGDVLGVYKKINYTITIPSSEEGFSGIISLFGSSNNTDSNAAAKSKTEPVDRATVAENQLHVYDMIVANGWGGNWFDSNYRNTLTADSFKVGDILWVRSTSIAQWYLLYTGEGKFVAYNSTTKDNTGSIDVDTVLNLFLKGKAFSYDLEGTATTMTPGTLRYYVLLRPSQILDQLTPDEPENPGTEPENPVDPQPPVEPEQPEIIGRELTETEKATLAALTAADINDGNWNGFAPSVYNHINITFDVPGTQNTTMRAMFAMNGNTIIGIAEKTADNENIHDSIDMLVANSWGGTWVSSEFGKNTLTVDMFKIGDLLCMRLGAGYWTALYQGNNQFLVAKNGSSAVLTMDEVLNMLETGMLGETDVSPVRAYWIMRPSQILEPATEPENPGTEPENPGTEPENPGTEPETPAEPINIEACTDWAAVQAKIEELINYDPAVLATESKGNVPNLANWVYNYAGIIPDGVVNLTGTNNDLNKRAADETNALNKAKVVGFDSMDDLQVGDLIFCNNPAVASHLVKDGDTDTCYFAKYTNLVYIGNETFICGERGVAGLRFMTFADFDDPATAEVEDFFDASTGWSYHTLLRFSNLIEG